MVVLNIYFNIYNASGEQNITMLLLSSIFLLRNVFIKDLNPLVLRTKNISL